MNGMSRRLASVGVAVATTTMVMALPAGGASAASGNKVDSSSTFTTQAKTFPLSNCQPNQFCVYTDNDFRGVFVNFTPAPGVTYTYSTAIGRAISSVANRTGRPCTVTSYGGSTHLVNKYLGPRYTGEIPRIGSSWGSGWNDNVARVKC
jgi:hypothetical protein